MRLTPGSKTLGRIRTQVPVDPLLGFQASLEEAATGSLSVYLKGHAGELQQLQPTNVQRLVISKQQYLLSAD